MFKELPASTGLVFNNRTDDSHWGKPEVIDSLIKIGKVWALPPISIGQISRRNGEHFPPHRTHRNGDDVDIRPMRADGKNLPVEWTQQAYSRNLTRDMIKTIRANAPIQSILFNDPVLIAERLCQEYPNHSDHLHVNFAAFPARPTLRRGSEGPDVRLLQEKLHIPIDGKFGPATERAVKAFQKLHGLSVDGVVGSASWRTLDLK